MFDAAAWLDLALKDPGGLATSLQACAGEGDPVSAAAKAAALAFHAVPDVPAPPSDWRIGVAKRSGESRVKLNQPELF
jgi:hypothetical protein